MSSMDAKKDARFRGNKVRPDQKFKSADKLTCAYCKKPGHLISDCLSLKNRNKVSAAQSVQDDNDDDEHDENYDSSVEQEQEHSDNEEQSDHDSDSDDNNRRDDDDDDLSHHSRHRHHHEDSDTDNAEKVASVQGHARVRQCLDAITFGPSQQVWSASLHLKTSDGTEHPVHDVMLDSGADPDLITMDVVKRAKLTLVPPTTSRTLKFGDGHEQQALGTVTLSGVMTFAAINKAPYHFTNAVFEVLPQSVASVLIGVHTLKLMFPDNELLQCHNNLPQRAQAPAPTLSISISHSTDSIVNQPNFYYLLFDNMISVATTISKRQIVSASASVTDVQTVKVAAAPVAARSQVSTNAETRLSQCKPLTKPLTLTSDILKTATLPLKLSTNAEMPSLKSKQLTKPTALTLDKKQCLPAATQNVSVPAEMQLLDKQTTLTTDADAVLKAAKLKAIATQTTIQPTEQQLLLLGYNVVPSMREMITDLHHFLPCDELPPKALVKTPDSLNDAQLIKIRAQILQRAKSLIDYNVAITGFCNDPAATVYIHMTPENQKLCHTRQYPMPEALVQLADEVIQNWGKKGLTEPAAIGTIVNNPILVAPKKAEDGSWTAIRVCLDLRNVNKRMDNDDRYEIPRITDALARLRGMKYFGQLDLEWAYLQFPIAKEYYVHLGW